MAFMSPTGSRAGGAAAADRLGVFIYTKFQDRQNELVKKSGGDWEREDEAFCILDMQVTCANTHVTEVQATAQTRM